MDLFIATTEVSGYRRAYMRVEEKNKDRTFVGKASTQERDRHGTVVLQDSLEKAWSNYTTRGLHFMHDPYAGIGQVLDADFHKNFVRIKGQVGEGFDVAFSESPFSPKTVMPVDNIWRQVEAGILRGLSIGFYADELNEDGADADMEPRSLRATDWIETSLCYIPSNRGSLVSAARGLARAELCPACQARLAEAGADPSVREAVAALAGRCNGEEEAVLSAIAKELEWKGR